MDDASAWARALPIAIAAAITLAGIYVGFHVNKRRTGAPVTEADKALAESASRAFSGGEGFGGIPAVPIESTAGIPALAQPPAGTAVRYVRTHDALMFRIPPNLGGIGAIVFLAVWLTGWTAGIFIASLFLAVGVTAAFGTNVLGGTIDLSGLRGPAVIFPIVFVGGWLFGAIAGETAALRMLFEELVRTFGEQLVIASRERLLQASRFGALERIVAYDVGQIGNLKGADGIRTMVGSAEGMQFSYGTRSAAITGMTKAEGDWMIAAIDQFRAA